MPLHSGFPSQSRTSHTCCIVRTPNPKGGAAVEDEELSPESTPKPGDTAELKDPSAVTPVICWCGSRSSSAKDFEILRF